MLNADFSRIKLLVFGWLSSSFAPHSHGWIHEQKTVYVNDDDDYDMGRQIAEYYIFHVCCGRFLQQTVFFSFSFMWTTNDRTYLAVSNGGYVLNTFKEGLRVLYSCIRGIGTRGETNTRITQTDLYWQIYLHKNDMRKGKTLCSNGAFQHFSIIEETKLLHDTNGNWDKKRKFLQQKWVLFEW